VFIPDGADFDVVRRAVGSGVRIKPISPEIAARPDVKDYVGRVAVNPDCFPDPGFPQSCVWLDSQAAIEDQLPSAIARTEILGTCPFVTYAGKAVP
jgi:hypothetical protein